MALRQTSNEPIPITINKISMTDYETHHYDNELLRQSATFIATIKFHAMTDLEQIRKAIEAYCEENANAPKLLPDWCFLDCKYMLHLTGQRQKHFTRIRISTPFVDGHLFLMQSILFVCFFPFLSIYFGCLFLCLCARAFVYVSGVCRRVGVHVRHICSMYG